MENPNDASTLVFKIQSPKISTLRIKIPRGAHNICNMSVAVALENPPHIKVITPIENSFDYER